MFLVCCTQGKFLIAKNAKYYFNFGCCFKNDSVKVNEKNIEYFFVANTDEITGIDTQNSFSFNSPNKKTTVTISLAQMRKNLFIDLVPINSDKFITLFLYRDSLYWSQNEKPLRGE